MRNSHSSWNNSFYLLNVTSPFILCYIQNKNFLSFKILISFGLFVLRRGRLASPHRDTSLLYDPVFFVMFEVYSHSGSVRLTKKKGKTYDCKKDLKLHLFTSFIVKMTFYEYGNILIDHLKQVSYRDIIRSRKPILSLGKVQSNSLWDPFLTF